MVLKSGALSNISSKIIICVFHSFKTVKAILFVFREQIVQMVERNPMIVVKGEPGCGKSTQVPQYIMEEWEALQRGAHCNIIVTQPRRLSAISLAERVAHERRERVSGSDLKTHIN
jgi:HrpA-like RNA helicase